MRRLLFFLIACISIMTSFMAFSQRKDYENYRDGSFIVVFSHTDEKNIICEVMSSNNVDSLIQNNRFIMSLVRTKFGYLVLHRPNVENMPQKFLYVSPSENVGKKLKKEFKLGWSVYYANYQKRFFILNKDMNVVNQEFKKKKYGKENEKLIKELNAKGFFIRWIDNDKYLIQQINGVVPNQKGVRFFDDNEFYYGDRFGNDGIIGLINKGYKIVDIEKSFNQYSFSRDPLAANMYNAILDEPNDEIPDILPKVVIMDTYEELQSYYNEIVSDNYNITKIFGGWDERDWKRHYEGIEEFNKTHSFNAILGGLISSGSSLINQINNNSNRSSSQSYNKNGHSEVQSSPNNKSKKWVSCETCKGTGVCRNCGGTGKYSYTKDGKCHECRPVGSGKCGTCKGKKGSYVQ